MNKRYFTQLVSAILALFIFACGEDAAASEDPNYTAIINSAWAKFSNANYTAAITEFNEAKVLDNQNPTAYTGIAWSQLLLKDYTNSQSEFDQGIALSDTIADLFAGRAFLLNARGAGADLSKSITAADAALALNSNWSFANGLSLSRTDLLVIKAQAQFLTNLFSASLSTIKEVDTNFNADISTPTGRAALQVKIESYNSDLN